MRDTAFRCWPVNLGYPNSGARDSGLRDRATANSTRVESVCCRYARAKLVQLGARDYRDEISIQLHTIEVAHEQSFHFGATERRLDLATCRFHATKVHLRFLRENADIDAALVQPDGCVAVHEAKLSRRPVSLACATPAPARHVPRHQACNLQQHEKRESARATRCPEPRLQALRIQRCWHYDMVGVDYEAIDSDESEEQRTVSA